MQDPTSDMAVVSKKGSGIVKFRREQKERRKAQKKEWELAGTRLGNLLGVANEERRDDAPLTESGELDLRAAHTFADKLPVSHRKGRRRRRWRRRRQLGRQRLHRQQDAPRAAPLAARLRLPPGGTSRARSRAIGLKFTLMYFYTCFSLRSRAAAATDS